MGLKLLAVGDLHLGRRPGSLPESLRDRARSLGPSAALDRLVTEAVASRVDAVAFAGDLVEQEDDFFEAYNDLRKAVARLSSAGIRVLGVAGNHDVEVLPALADELPAFELLGRDGQWQHTTLRSADGVELVVHGYSFPRPWVTDNPLNGQVFERDHRPAIGLLHCDLDQPRSRYAPVSRQQLVQAGLDAFLLGHIHRPDPLSHDHTIGYLGSVTPLRHTETGRHGPWLFEFEQAGLLSVEQWPLAPLRWQDLAVELDPNMDPTAARSQLLSALRQWIESDRDPRFDQPVFGVKVSFNGRNDHRAGLEALLEGERVDSIQLADDSWVFIREITYQLLPSIDLNHLAVQPDPVGLLAQRLLWLSRPSSDPERKALLAAARERSQHVLEQPLWAGLPDWTPTETELESMVRELLMQSIDALLAQRREDAS